ncbi:MAG: hypothetical protein EF812_06600 [Methanosarcinales archaeon]|nr:MAG: hypothetical protein EF812_06600 [Methanosarcinales archaeon]
MDNPIRTAVLIISAIEVIIVNRTDLSPLIMYGLSVVLVITAVLLMWPSIVSQIINPYKNWRETRKNNKIAKRFLKEFKDSNFMDSFKLFIADSSSMHKSYAFHFVIKKLLEKKEFKGKIPEPPVNLMNLYFSFWTEIFTRFDATKEDLKLVFF